ncbi:MAG TPA: chloride channel protein [Chitinophagaceae bacterium]|jgi:H+/Cl- antiporter ClcA|nr:chloride channel protein [Chitinophagaceae bacterium]
MTDFSRRRRWIQLRNQINAPLRLNPFVFTKSFFLWVTLGIVGGIVAGLYWLLINFLMTYFIQFTQWWEIIGIMSLGGLAIGLIIHFVSETGEMDEVVNNIRFNGGKLETRYNPAMIATSAIGIGVGGSAGPEAPMVQVIGSIGSWMAKKLKLKGEEHRSMSIAGMATGFTAMFGAPLGGSLFSLEIMHHKHVVEYYQALIPAFVASGTSYIVFVIITQLGLAPVWTIPIAPAQPGVLDFFWAMLYGAAGACVGWGVIWMFRKLKQGFRMVRLPIYVQTLIGGVVLGVLGWKFPITRFFGHYQLIDLLHQSLAINVLIAILVIKVVSMALTVSSGWRGGFIIPLFFIGAALGLIIYRIFPGQSLPLAVVSCMAAVNACVTRTPISTIILVATMTGYHDFIPILFASLTGFFLAPKTPLISAQLGKDKKLLHRWKPGLVD